MSSYNQKDGSNSGLFSKMLRKLSSLGMNYDTESFTQRQAVGVNEEPHPVNNDAEANQFMYDVFAKRAISKILDKKSIAFLDGTYLEKRQILQQYAMKDEIRDYLTQIADEAIVYDEKNFFCKPCDLPQEFDEIIRKKLHENFYKIYNKLGFSDGVTAWNYFKKLLINGYIAFEIVYDKQQKNIIDLVELDPITLVVASDPETGTIVWIQYPNDPKLRRIILDAKIVYISYSNNQEFSETSYVEPLIRPYNQMKLLEQTKIIYNINQAAIYKKFIIPIGGMPKKQAEQQIQELMATYHEEIQFDEGTGMVYINGNPQPPHSKDIWLPNGAEGTPEVDLVSPSGNDLNEDQILNWFMNILRRTSKIPFARFEKESGGGNLYQDASEMTRDEIKFHTFIKRLRTIYKEIILKPLKLQMMRDFPELMDDYFFISNLNINFNTNELFEEWKYLANLEKRSTIAASLISNIPYKEDQSYFATEWIVRNIMKLSDSEISENEKFRIKEFKILGRIDDGDNSNNLNSGGGADFYHDDFGSPSSDSGSAESGSAESSGSSTESDTTQTQTDTSTEETPTEPAQ